MDRKAKTAPANYQVSLSENANRNIDEITDFIAFEKQEPLSAIKVGEAIFCTIDRIAASPLSFKECGQLPTKKKLYRQAKCFNWTIIYRVKSEAILILGIIHSSRKPSASRTLKKIK